VRVLRRTRWATLLLGALLSVGACTSGRDDTPAAPASTSASAQDLPRDEGQEKPQEQAQVEPQQPAAERPAVWLCRPGLAVNPCEGDLDTTVVAADGSGTTVPFRPAGRPAFDCFYVYPTVSTSPTTNAPRRVTSELVDAVRAQAALFGRECRVFAPVYRQVTLLGLVGGGFTDPEARGLAHADVVAAWREYLQRWNHGRPFLLLGHSQGSFELTSLIDEEIDDAPALRERMVSAMLLGAAVTVAEGEDVGGSFDNVPACRSRSQSGCVLAYNTFAQTPAEGSLFGRAIDGQQVLCVNPAAPAGGSAPVTPYVPRESAEGRVQGFTAYPDAVGARCRTGDGATWLHVRPDETLPAELTTAALGAGWGLHRLDVNIALGELISLAAAQAASLD
jgi:hypothetical protein